MVDMGRAAVPAAVPAAEPAAEVGVRRAGRVERATGWAAVVCGVHCLASPVLVLAVPVLALGEVVERTVLLVLLPLSVWLMWRGVRRHRRPGPCVPVAAGLLCWVAALLGVVGEGSGEAVVAAAGGALLFVGLQWSARETRSCGCSRCGTP
jgi:hypothetical protein